MKPMVAKDFMDKSGTVAHPDMALTELVRLFAEHRVRALPVADDEGRLAGVVTESDLFLKRKGVPFSIEKVTSLLGEVVDKDQLAQVERCRHIKVGEVMTKKVATVGPDDTLHDVAMRMHNRRVSVLPVVVDGRLAGVVRRVNVLSEIYRED